MPTTTTYGLPVPEETDKLGESDERIRELADFLGPLLLEPEVYSGYDRVHDALDLVPTSGTTSFGISEAQMVTQGLHVQLDLQLQYGGPGLTPPANGVLTPSQLVLGKIGDPGWLPRIDVAGHTYLSRVATFLLDPSGEFRMVAVGNTTRIENGEPFNVSFTYIKSRG